MSTAMQNLNFIISLTDKVTKPLGGIMKGMDSLNRAQSGLMKFGIGTAGIVGAGYAIDKLTEKAIGFESAMADVRKVTDFPTPAGLAQFSDELLKLSRTIPISAEGLAQIATAGGQMGIAEKDLIGFTKIVAKMSTAFDMLPDAAGEAIAKLSNIFHIPVQDMERVGDAINTLDNNMAAKSRDIVDVLARIGGTSQLLGLTANQAGALSAAMLSLGQTPELAGTSINALLLRLGTAQNQSKDFKAALGDIGLSVEQLQANLKSGGAQATINDFLARLSKLDKAAQLNTLGQLFGAEYSDNLGVLVGGLDQYQKALGLINQQSQFQGSMQKEFATRSATTANHLKLLSNLWDNLAINLGTVFLPLVNSAVSQISAFIEPLVTGIKDFAKQYPVLTQFLVKFAGLGTVIGVVAFGLVAIGGLMAMLSSSVILIAVGATALGAAIMTWGGPAIDYVMGRWQALKDWWANFSVWGLVLQPFKWVYGGAMLAVDAVLGVFETVRGWWASFKGWLASLDPFGALLGGINNVIAKVSSIGTALRSALSVGGGIGAPAVAGGVAPRNILGKLQGGNSSTKNVTVNINNNGGSVSPAAIGHHLRMAGG